MGSDVAEVKADIEETVGYYDGVEEAMPDALRGVLDAARRWVRVVSETERVEWCLTHRNAVIQTGMFPPDTCWSFNADAESCHLIPALLVAAVGVEKETTDE